MPTPISRASYASMYGPTTGDRVRLGDTDLMLQVERDLTTYGEEVKFGGGKVIRDGMGQSQISRAGGAMDTVITNALIVDYTGIYKADVGLRDRLKTHGRFVKRPEHVITSARRFAREGICRQQLRNAAIMAGYTCGISPVRLAAFYSVIR